MFMATVKNISFQVIEMESYIFYNRYFTGNAFKKPIEGDLREQFA